MNNVPTINVRTQVALNKRLGLVWSGWMGGQWAMTPEILTWVEGRPLVVLCGGPGDLALNAIITGGCPYAINVDALTTPSVYSAEIVKYLSMIQGPFDTALAVAEANEACPLVPSALAQPHFPERMQSLSGFKHVQSDALEYVSQQALPLNAVYYLATPTSFIPEGQDKPFHFYSIYEKAFGESLGHGGFAEWGDKNAENEYLQLIVETIFRRQPDARIIFGVGEGEYTPEEYCKVLAPNRDCSIVLNKRFCLDDGYAFTDWLIVVE